MWINVTTRQKVFSKGTSAFLLDLDPGEGVFQRVFKVMGWHATDIMYWIDETNTVQYYIFKGKVRSIRSNARIEDYSGYQEIYLN